MAAACANPLEALPHTVFPEQRYHYLQQQPQPQQQQQARNQQHINFPPPAPRNCFSPHTTREFCLDPEDEAASIQNQVSTIEFFDFCFSEDIQQSATN